MMAILKVFILISIVWRSMVMCRPQQEFPDNDNNDGSDHRTASFYNQKDSARFPIDDSSRNPHESSSAYWRAKAQEKLLERVNLFPNLNIAKNVIFFLGDGMSIPTLAASRIYKGQLNGQTGEEAELSFEKFPNSGLAKTYCVNAQIADSACSATAYLGGVKGNIFTIGVDANVEFNDCEASKNSAYHVDSLAALAQRAGKATGVVTTTTVTHATPGGTYAHVSNRNFESDGDVAAAGKDPAQCEDIATQLMLKEPGKHFRVIMGGGRVKFLPNNTKDESDNFGQRLDGKNLIKEWLKCHGHDAKYVYNRTALQNVNYLKTNYLLGLFQSQHMHFAIDADPEVQPSLAEMTEAAVKVLEKDDDGYFLLVEGGLIDAGHHIAKANKALDETVQFSEAIERAVKLTSEEDTLIIVTADHAHTMSLAGYSNRGNNILGLSTNISPIDNLPYTTLSYANGPGFKPHINEMREDLTNTEFGKDYQYPGLVPLQTETHGGDDVAVFAYGPWSHLFSGTFEQNVIPHMVAYAACLGDGLTTCNDA